MSEPLRVDELSLAAFELFSTGDLYAAVEIRACRSCQPWFLEAQPGCDGHVLVRERHAADCPHLRTLLADDVTDGCSVGIRSAGQVIVAAP